MNKQCTKCGIVKDLSEFHRSKKEKDGRVDRCKVCHSEYRKQHHIENKERNSSMRKKWEELNRERMIKYRKGWIKIHPKNATNYWLKNRYGITVDQKEQMRIQQDNKCAICGMTFIESKFIHVDHDHSSGKVRSLLCHGCNLMIGYGKESIATLKRACEYLEKWSSYRG